MNPISRSSLKGDVEEKKNKRDYLFFHILKRHIIHTFNCICDVNNSFCFCTFVGLVFIVTICMVPSYTYTSYSRMWVRHLALARRPMKNLAFTYICVFQTYSFCRVDKYNSVSLT